MLILRDRGRLVTWQHFKTSWDSSVAQQHRCLWLYSNDSSQVQQEFGTSQIPQNDGGWGGGEVISNPQHKQAGGEGESPELLQTGEGHSERTKQAIVPHLRPQQQHSNRSQALGLSSPPLQCLSISAPVSPSGDQKWHKRRYGKKIKKTRQLLCMERAGALNKQKTKGDHVQEGKQRTRTTFPRVRRSQWLHKDICCIHLQYLKKALLSLRCIYTSIGFFLASK